MWTVCWNFNFAISFPLRSNSARVKNLTYNNFLKIKIIKVVTRGSFVSNVCIHSSVDSNTQLVSERHGFEFLRCRTFFRASLRSQFLQLICENHVCTQTYFRTSFECQPSGKSVLQEKRAPENKKILSKYSKFSLGQIMFMGQTSSSSSQTSTSASWIKVWAVRWKNLSLRINH